MSRTSDTSLLETTMPFNFEVASRKVVPEEVGPEGLERLKGGGTGSCTGV